jgi:hypothetical protein
MRKILTIIITVFSAVTAYAEPLNNMASNWLDNTCSSPGWCGGADIDYSGDVNFIDFALLASHWGNAEGFYVAVNGDDNNPGTFLEPFATIQKAADTVVAGDTVYIRAGSYHEAVTMTGKSGTAADPITFTNYNGEDVTLDGSIPITSGWIPHSGSIYKTTLSEDVWQLFVDGKTMISARWPNAKWDDDSIWDRDGNWGRGTSSDSNGVQYDNGARDLAGSGLDMTGAIALLNVGNWKTWAKIVDSHSAGANFFTYAPVSNGYKDSWSNHRFFFECKLNLLDAPEEWFYNPGTKTLYIWADDGLDPTGRDVRGKVQSYFFDISNSSYIKILGLDFFGTTFRSTDCLSITVEDCDLLYPSYSRRMLGVLSDTDVTMIKTGSNDDSSSVIRNCTFRYTDGPALYIWGKSNIVENCYFGDIDYSAATVGGNGFSIHMIKCKGTTYRRNTLYKAGTSEGYRAGGYDAALSQIVEYNHHYKCGLLQSDGANFQMGANVERDAIVRYNWAHDSDKYGYRFDGGFHKSSFSLSNLIHHNVGWNCGNISYRIKGDEHETYNNIGYNGDYPPIVIRRLYSENQNSITRNNASDVISGEKGNPAAAIPGTHSNNWNGRDFSLDVREVLRDPDNWDFRPKADPNLVDAGMHIPGITDGYLGSAPDIGAYEFGDANYWIPGYQAPKASTPIPPDGASNVKLDADLMWLAGYKAISHNVYFGTDPNNLVFQQNQTNNIFDPGPLQDKVTYYWKIDTVTQAGTIAGDVWQISANSPQMIFEPTDDSYVEDTSPTVNYGNDADIELRTPELSGATRHGYLKFNVNVPGPIASATLRLYSANTLSGGISIYGVSDTSWSEGAINWNNRPAIDGSLLASGSISEAYSEFDVTSYITGNGAFSFGLIRGAKDSNRRVSSKEGANPPQLVVSY